MEDVALARAPTIRRIGDDRGSVNDELDVAGEKRGCDNLERSPHTTPQLSHPRNFPYRCQCVVSHMARLDWGVANAELPESALLLAPLVFAMVIAALASA